MQAFSRNIELYLEEWKRGGIRKPLIIRGARQVGKTTIIKQFALSYRHRILLNLEKEKDRVFFEEYQEVKVLIEALFLTHNLSIEALGETLLFLDEIQASPQAIQLLRYFYEELPDLHVIAAGSLLEFAMQEVKSFPVGRVEYRYLYPLNFEEFLAATDHQEALTQFGYIPVKPFAHLPLLNLFNQYGIVGGMPEVVRTYIEKESMTALPGIYESIWGTYQNDVVKYASNDTERRVIRHIMATAHLYLDQRIKFQNFGNSNYRSREVGEALQNLDDAKIIQIIYPTTEVQVPIKPDLKKSPRLQLLDTGLVNYLLGIQADMLALKDLSHSYKGAIIPHLITQELLSLNRFQHQKPHFWVREKRQASAEVDLVLSFQDKVIPVEVKSGSVGKLRSLHQFMDRTNHPYAVRIYGGTFHIQKVKTLKGTPFFLMNLPYYLGTKLPEYLAYFVENYEMK